MGWTGLLTSAGMQREPLSSVTQRFIYRLLQEFKDKPELLRRPSDTRGARRAGVFGLPQRTWVLPQA